MASQAQASTLDIDKFRKVRGLMDGGSTDGERSAARARAEAMAKRAGMTLKEALSKVDGKPKASDPDAEFWAQMRRSQQQKSARYAGRRAELLHCYGSVKAVFDPKPIEAAIFAAATPFAIRMPYQDYCGTQRWYSSVLGGASSSMHRLNISEACKAAIRAAWPVPATLVGLLAEARLWDEIWRDRQAFAVEKHDHDYEISAEADCRREIIEHELNTRPVTSWDDMQARFEWKRFEWERQWIDPTEESEDGIVPTLRRDFEILRGIYERPTQNRQGSAADNLATASARRTNADKRRDVLSMLDAMPSLADREIARRVGVSPQTVGNWRRRT